VLARSWDARRGPSRLFGLAGTLARRRFGGLAPRGSLEQRYLRWSAAKSAVLGVLALAVLGVVAESLLWSIRHGITPQAGITRFLHQTGLRPAPFPETTLIPPAGEPLTFTMGSTIGDADERPPHPVTFKEAFHMSRAEVTFAQYAAFAEATARPVPLAGQLAWDEADGPLPVVDVTWINARDYADWLDAMTGAGCRLPSEAQWEFACRAGNDTEYWWGDEFDPTKANTNETGSGRPVSVQSKGAAARKNPWGLYDMNGNVWEWVEDHWSDTYDFAPPDGEAWLEEEDDTSRPRVLRGGSWGYPRDGARCAYRYGGNPDYRSFGIGFRVVCSSPILTADR
jgi:formylglycine-generating enzyme required for sulfatase activity